MIAHDDLVYAPSVPAGDHPARCMAPRAFHLSYRDVEDPIVERGLAVSYETMRREH